jgi:hypothetical protein
LQPRKRKLDESLLESATFLEKKYESVMEGKEDLEKKLEIAKQLKEKLFQLKSGKDFLPQEDISQLDQELRSHSWVIYNSSIAELEIRMLEEKISKIKSSSKFVIPSAKDQITNRIELIQKSVTNATKVQNEISKAENNSGYCSEEEIEKLQKELNSVQNVLMKLQTLNPGKA